MKIGVITNLYPPYARGGAENVVVRSVEALGEFGHDVFVISTHPHSHGEHAVRDSTSTQHIYRFFPRNVYHTLKDSTNPWLIRLVWHIIDAFGGSGMREVGKILDEEEPDVVITHNLKGIGLRIPETIRQRNLPHVHIAHDLQLIYPSGLLFAGREKTPWYVIPFYAVYRAICRARLGNPDTVVFPSRYLRDVYVGMGFCPKSRVEVIPNPAPRFSPVVRGTRSAGPMRLLFVGQLEDHKGVRFLLDACKKFSCDAQLIFAGEGSRKIDIENAAAENKRITYLGFISLEQLVNCLGVVDALVVPSLCYENSPTVIYESLNAGVPVIAADIGGVGELIENGKNGFLFKPGDDVDLHRAVRELDARKEELWATQDAIRATVAPHELKAYTAKLVALLEQARK